MRKTQLTSSVPTHKKVTCVAKSMVIALCMLRPFVRSFHLGKKTIQSYSIDYHNKRLNYESKLDKHSEPNCGNYRSAKLLMERNCQRTSSILDNCDEKVDNISLNSLNRRIFLSALPVVTQLHIWAPNSAHAEETIVPPPVQVVASGDAKQFFNEARALESQGNIAAAKRLYGRVTKISPRFIYGWSNLGNTQVALGELQSAEGSYSKAIELCKENRKEEERFGVRRCDDLYLLYLNRGSLRLNNEMPQEALKDFETADSLRQQPDAIILQNRARARELNGLYASADRDYTVAISMTSNSVSPFWLRSALVKFQLGDFLGAFDLCRRVENKFPEAPEVRAAIATLLSVKGDQTAAQRKFLEIPDKQRMKYVDEKYMKTVISWPPKMIEALDNLTKAVGDDKRFLSNGNSLSKDY